MGNGLVRRVLIETSWHYKHRAGVGPGLAARRKGQPAHVIAIADKAQQRLCRRFPPHGRPQAGAQSGRRRPPELAAFLSAALQPPTVGEVTTSPRG